MSDPVTKNQLSGGVGDRAVKRVVVMSVNQKIKTRVLSQQFSGMNCDPLPDHFKIHFLIPFLLFDVDITTLPGPKEGYSDPQIGMQLSE